MSARGSDRFGIPLSVAEPRIAVDRRSLIRLSGLMAIVGGVINPLVDLLSPAPGSPLEWGYFFGGIAIAFGLVGIYAVQIEESGVAGFLGFVLAFVGRAYFSAPGASIGGVDATEAFGGVYAMGVILLAAASLRTGRLPRWVPAAWLAAVIVGPSSLVAPSAETLALQAGAVALGIGFVGAGIALWVRQPDLAVAPGGQRR